MDEKRHYSRVSTRVQAYARATDSVQDAPRFMVGHTGTPPSASLDGAKLPQPVIQFLIGLDRKLDTLLAHQALERIERDYPIHLDVREVSGNGLRFMELPETPPGTELEVVMLLREAPLRLVAAKGRVQDDPRGKTCGFEFVTLRESDLESIVSFVFEEERQRIRENKMSR